MADKPSTDDILAKLRKEAQGGGGGDETPASAQPAAETRAPAPPAGETPTSTNDIMAALRAQGGKAASEPSPAPAARTGETPKSTNDIMAALRAQSGKGASPAAESKPAAPKKAGAPASLPDGEKPSVEEMLKGLRGEAKAADTAPAKPAKPTMPPLPTKPPVASKKKEPETRRNFLIALVATPFALAWTAFTASAGAFTLGLARFMMPNVLVEPPSTFKVGPPSDYPPGTVSTKWKAQFAVWLVHAEYEGKSLIYALSTVCTHLGCTPNWLEGEQKFKCPCHGSGFYINGINFEGPAPRPLERHAIRVAPDGMLEVDKSRKFQQELGQWEDGNSKVEVV